MRIYSYTFCKCKVNKYSNSFQFYKHWKEFSKRYIHVWVKNKLGERLKKFGDKFGDSTKKAPAIIKPEPFLFKLR